MQGYIKLYREILDWEWYNDINVKILFLHCLLKANHQDKKWQGVVIPKGSFITSYENLSIETGLTVRQVRVAIDKLKMTGEMAHKGQARYSIITIKNWDKFQENDKQNDKQMTNKRQTNDKQMTTNKNDKNEKNDKNNITPLPPLGENDILLQRVTNDLPLINRDKWKGLVQEWLSYKREKKQTYQSERSLRAFIKNLLKLSDSEFLKAELIVSRSIGNNWSGIFALSDSVNKKESEVLGECWGLT